MFRITVAALIVVLAVSAAPALAGKAGSPATSSIAIASVSGSGNTAAAQSTPRLGDTLTFKTTVEPLAGWEYPMVAVSCYQDMNGDGKSRPTCSGPMSSSRGSTDRVQASRSAATRPSGPYEAVATQCAAPTSMPMAGSGARSRRVSSPRPATGPQQARRVERPPRAPICPGPPGRFSGRSYGLMMFQNTLFAIARAPLLSADVPGVKVLVSPWS